MHVECSNKKGYLVEMNSDDLRRLLRFLHCCYLSKRVKTSPIKEAPMNAKQLGIKILPKLFLVGEAATLVVTVVTSGAIVVPGTVVTASASTDVTVLPPTTVGAEIVVEMTEGETVVPGIVVVYVTS